MSKCILVVEDTPDLLENITDFLRMEGYKVIPCDNGIDALQLISDSDLIPDLIITDLWMPAMDGFDFIERIRNISALENVKVVVFSAKPVQENELRAKSLGVRKYIKKPCAPDKLVEIVGNIVNE